MERRDFVTTALGSLAALTTTPRLLAGLQPPTPAGGAATGKILIAGGGFNKTWIRYMAQLTGKTKPKVLYLPTASADRPGSFMENCEGLEVEPIIQNSFISSYRMDKTWEETFLSVDAIIASGGNTLNQQAIWKAQGIDVILREAWDRGIVLGGASAGSLCWFEEGSTDSRPKALSIVKCLGFIPGSHCPHYDREAQRRPQYQGLIASGEMKPGWACDNDAGIYFEGTEVKRIVSARAGARVYYVSAEAGKAVEKPYEPEMIS
jgi:peptidase E